MVLIFASSAGLAEPREFLRRIGDAEQLRGGAVDRRIGRLGRQDHGDQQGEGVAIFELGLGMRVEVLKAAEDLVDLGLGQP